MQVKLKENCEGCGAPITATENKCIWCGRSHNSQIILKNNGSSSGCNGSSSGCYSDSIANANANYRFGCGMASIPLYEAPYISKLRF